MGFFQRIAPIRRLFQPRERRAWTTETRAHVELPELSGDELRRFAEELSSLTGSITDVAHVQVNGYARRVIFHMAGASWSLSELVALVSRAERLARLDNARFSEEIPEHPADVEPRLRTGLELSADTVAMLVGAALRISPFPAMPLAGNGAAVLSLLGSAPRLRAGLERRVGVHRTELLLSLAKSTLTAAAQRPSSSLVDVAHKMALLREIEARQRSWEQLEVRLCAEAGPALVGEDALDPRPVELPRGPIEEYADRAWVVALAGFGLSFATTRSVQRAVSAIYGSLPRPARLGRDAFCADLARQLADKEALVVDPTVLRRLDRIDCLVLEGDMVAKQRFSLSKVSVSSSVDEAEARRRADVLFDPERPLTIQTAGSWELAPLRRLDTSADPELEEDGRRLARSGALVLGLADGGALRAVVEVRIEKQTGVEELVAAAHEAQMRVVVAAEDEAVLSAIQADDVIAGRDGIRAGIRRLQREGRAVCLVSRGPSEGLRLADCGIGLRREGFAAPWGAHIICRDDLSDVRFVIEASRRARDVSKQSVNIALGAASLGAVVSAGGLLPLTARRVLFVVNSATLVSMANGIRKSGRLARQALPTPRDPTPWHALEADGALERLGSSREGLALNAAVVRRTASPRPPSALSELGDAVTEELFNPLAPLLAAGAGLSAAVGSIADAVMVGSVVGLNAVLGGVQRFRADRKIRDLSRFEVRRAMVRREGRLSSVDSRELVPGDVVLLTAGDVVPADCRLIEATALEVDASSQTGESLPVKKSATPCFDEEIADRGSMVYEGTAVAAGGATAVVVAVGDETEARRGASVAKAGRSQGGVERRLRSLMSLTGPVAVAAGAGVVAGGLLRGRKLEDLVGSGVSLAVASVPEGLPLLATAAQLSAAERLTAHGALVRNARSIEALGRVDVICLDKTGTITQGRIALAMVSDGETEESSERLSLARLGVLAAALRATGVRGAAAHREDPTDDALFAGADAAAVDATYGCDDWKRQAELSLRVGRTYHAVLGRRHQGGLLCVKGAPEALLLECTSRQRGSHIDPLDDAGRMELVRAAGRLAGRGFRVLAVAERPIPIDVALTPGEVCDLTFRGFVAFSDPVRPTAAAAIAGLGRAAVETVMITGDHPSTARAIADELGLLKGKRVLTGAELAALTDDGLDHVIGEIGVFARVTPSQKVRVVRALQRAGRVVAMAGDGANDAAAIRLADVGIAVGEASTSAARGAADLVLTDGRVETLVDAIVEGRAMWASVRSAVGILMGGNLGEIGFTLAAGLVDGRPPLAARQLLLVNLLTDVAPAMAIALRPPEVQTFDALARENPDVALGAALDQDIATRAAVTALGAGGAWVFGRLTGGEAKARTIALMALVGTQLGQTMTSGGYSRPVVLTSLLSMGFLSAIVQTPGVSHFFGCRPLGPIAWTAAIGASAAATLMSGRIASLMSGGAEAPFRGTGEPLQYPVAGELAAAV